MKILFLTHEFPPVGGGAGKIIKNLAIQYVSKGHEVHILTSRYKKFSNDFSIDNIFFHYIWGSRKSELDNNIILTFLSFLFFGVIKGYKIVKTFNIDIIHSSMSIPGGFTGVILNKMLNKPHILSLHGSDVPYHSSSKIMILIKPLIKYILLNTDKIILVSHELLKTLDRTINRNRIKTEIIYAGVNLPDNPNSKDINTQKVNIIKCISLGRLVELKGYQDVIMAVNKIKEDSPFKLEYKIIGDGPYKNNLIKLVKRLNLVDCVKFLGLINNQEKKSKFLYNSDIFIGTSHTEAMGLVFIEALAHGLPVIGSDVGGIPEVINSDDYGSLVKPGDINDIANAIIHVSMNINQYDKNKIVNRAKMFSWVDISEQYLNQYENLLN